MDSELLRRHLATHEAGHATIGRVLNLTCGLTTIVPDETCSSTPKLAMSGAFWTSGAAKADSGQRPQCFALR
jgi:hypothetical protein